MRNETTIRKLKYALQIGDKTALIREAIEELESKDRTDPPTNDTVHEHRCDWCNAVLGKQAVGSDGKSYCSIGCAKSAEDRRRIDALEGRICRDIIRFPSR